MTELRMADPTLDSIEPNAVIALDYVPGGPPLGHIAVWSAKHRHYAPECYPDPDFGGWETATADQARWFAVPCHVCFHDAPEHGTDPLQRPKAGTYLKWQTESARAPS